MIGVEPTILFTDFETFYTQDYSLTKMSPAEYILSPLFEAICLGVATTASDVTHVDGPDIPQFVHKLKQHDKPIAMVSHNAQFDMSIMSWRYDFHPHFIIDTIAMSRTVLGSKLASHSLDSVARYFNLPHKGSLIKDVKGMGRLDIIAAGLWQREVEYCEHDTWLCREIYKTLFPLMPPDEFVLHDIITRCTTEPLLKVDREMLQAHLAEVLARKEQTLRTVESMGITKAHLMSGPKFADVLRSLGIEPPRKTSPQTGEETYAFAKDDEEFIALRDHSNPVVRTVIDARLETKSTIEETRTRRFIAISNLDFPALGDCRMPMPVVIGAAHTHRVGGGWDLNVQNMGRGSRLRDAIHAEDGHALLAVDSRQIEARFNAWFSGQTDLLEQFRRGEDVYSDFASQIFERKIDRNIHKPEGLVGKTGILQLGYASGWLKFQRTVWNQTRDTETPIILSDWQSQDIVRKYRQRYAHITAMWGTLDYILKTMYLMPEFEQGEGTVLKCVTFYKNLMVGPTGLHLHFPDLHWEQPEGEYGSWWFRDGKKMRKTYGASLLETICQHCARCIVMGAAVRLRNPMAGLGARLVHSAHDELVYSIPVEQLATAQIWAEMEMNRPPSWAPDLPLACEIGTGQRYGEC